MTRDLHASELANGNIMTEYERNFTSQGMPIYSAHVVFNKSPASAEDTETEAHG